MSEQVYQQLRSGGRLREASHVRAYDATPIRGQSTRAAIAHAQEWLVSQSEGSTTNDESSGKVVHEDRG
jgi:hypothetical protein